MYIIFPMFIVHARTHAWRISLVDVKREYTHMYLNKLYYRVSILAMYANDVRS